MRTVVLILLLFVSVSCTTSPSREPAGFTKHNYQLTGWNFDWDDNIAYMQTDVLLYRKKSAPEGSAHHGLIVSTEEFSEIRHQMGPGGSYQYYEVLNDDRVGTFRYFSDGRGNNPFLDDVKELVENSARAKGAGTSWHGPSWNEFVEALNDPISSQWTNIITARGHSREAIAQALEYLRAHHIIRFVPPAANLYAVSHPEYAGTAANPSAAKVDAMTKILDRMNAVPLDEKMIPVIPPDGSDKKIPLHLWGFSDDDYGNYTKARDVLAPLVKSGRWPNVKITLFYTGRMHHESNGEQTPKHSIVIQPDGSVRPALSEEAGEADLIRRHR